MFCFARDQNLLLEVFKSRAALVSSSATPTPKLRPFFLKGGPRHLTGLRDSSPETLMPRGLPSPLLHLWVSSEFFTLPQCVKFSDGFPWSLSSKLKGDVYHSGAEVSGSAHHSCEPPGALVPAPQPWGPPCSAQVLQTHRSATFLPWDLAFTVLQPRMAPSLISALDSVS